MGLEYAVLVVLILMAITHTCFNRMYSGRISQLDTAVVESEFDSDGSDIMIDELTDGMRMLAQARMDRIDNYYALIVCIISIGVLAILILLHHIIGMAQAGWMSLFFLPLSACMLWHHIGSEYTITVRQRSLWSGLSAQSH